MDTLSMLISDKISFEVIIAAITTADNSTRPNIAAQPKILTVFSVFSLTI